MKPGRRPVRIPTIVGVCVVITIAGGTGTTAPVGAGFRLLSSVPHPVAVGRSGMKLTGQHVSVEHGSFHGMPNWSSGGNVVSTGGKESPLGTVTLTVGRISAKY